MIFDTAEIIVDEEMLILTYVLLYGCNCIPLVKATCSLVLFLRIPPGEDNMLLLRDRWSRQRIPG